MVTITIATFYIALQYLLYGISLLIVYRVISSLKIVWG